MARVLTLTGAITLPDDEFDAAGIVTRAKAGIDAAAKAMGDALQDGSSDAVSVFSFDVKIGKPRRTRKPNGTGTRVRKPRAAATPSTGSETPAA